jgi:uncharacterized protein (TIGR00251 family)
LIDFTERDGAVSFKVRVQPRASRTEIAGEHAGALKLRISAPPVDGKANEECRRFLARRLKVAAGAVEIVSGESSREKIIRVHNITAERVRQLLA